MILGIIFYIYWQHSNYEALYSIKDEQFLFTTFNIKQMFWVVFFKSDVYTIPVLQF